MRAARRHGSRADEATALCARPGQGRRPDNGALAAQLLPGEPEGSRYRLQASAAHLVRGHGNSMPDPSGGAAPPRRRYSTAAADRASSRSTCFWILPVEVFGSGPNTTLLGALKCARLARQCSISSASLACAPGLSST
jgi:hypothetical protein